jgi:hypothetical protein
MSTSRSPVVAPIAAVAILAAAPGVGMADQDPELETISTAGVEFGRAAVGCSIVKLEFGGELYAKRPRQPREPVSKATFQCSGPWHDPEPCEVKIDPDGSFRGLATAWDHTYVTSKSSGKDKVKHSYGRAWVTIQVPGCRERTLTVDRKWRDRRIVLKCERMDD